MAEPEIRLVAKLKATAEVTAIVGAKVYPGRQVPQGTALPYLVYYVIDKVPVTCADGATDTSHARIQLDCYHTSYSLAKALGIAVREAIGPEGGWTDGTGALWLVENETEIAEDIYPGQSVGPYGIRFDLITWYAN